MTGAPIRQSRDPKVNLDVKGSLVKSKLEYAATLR